MPKKEKDKKKKEIEKEKDKVKDEIQSLMELMEKKGSTEIIPTLKITHTKEEEEADEVAEEIGSVEMVNDKTNLGEQEKFVKNTPSFLAQEKDITSSELTKLTNMQDITTPIKESGKMETQQISDKEIITPSIELKSIKLDINPTKYLTPGSLYGNLGIFFKELIESSNERYDMWEESLNHILSLLKKFEYINRINSEILIKSIEKSYKKIEEGLNKFKLKRDYIEEISGIEYTKTISYLNRTLVLLQLNLKMLKIKDLLDQFYTIYSK